MLCRVSTWSVTRLALFKLVWLCAIAFASTSLQIFLCAAPALRLSFSPNLSLSLFYSFSPSPPFASYFLCHLVFDFDDDYIALRSDNSSISQQRVSKAIEPQRPPVNPRQLPLLLPPCQLYCFPTSFILVVLFLMVFGIE